jgi:hypothetical protein
MRKPVSLLWNRVAVSVVKPVWLLVLTMPGILKKKQELWINVIFVTNQGYPRE